MLIPKVSVEQCKYRTFIKRLYYGYNPADLFLRLELNENPASLFLGLYLRTLRDCQVVNQYTRFDGSNAELEMPDMTFDCEICEPSIPGTDKLCGGKRFGSP